MKNSASAWDRLMWGVVWESPGYDDVLIGSVSLTSVTKSHYHGEPTRALLFTTRKLAREYCQSKRAQYKGRTDSCGKWKFRPVRVRETVGLAGIGKRREKA